MPEPYLASYGSSPYEKISPDCHETVWHLVAAVRDCLARAGLTPSDVDGLALASFSYPPGNVITLAEMLSLRLRWCEEGQTGGAAGVQLVGHAADQVRLGRARCALVVCGDAFRPGDHARLLENFAPAMRDHIGPHGFGGANGLLAMLQTRHAHLHGTRRDQLARLCVTQREHALLNPNALFDRPLTVEQVLDARPIAEPFHLFDCVMPCSGAEAVLVVSEDVSRALARPPVRLRAMREIHNSAPDELSSLDPGWRTVGDELWAETGYGPGDVDLAELYDDYPIAVGLQLEGYGFCREGGCGPFLESTDVSIRGSLPINTGGGQLSVGQSGAGGGLIHVTEAVQQLQGEAGARQVADARVGLVSGYGYISYGKGMCVAAAVLERGDA
ncbi:MAG: thiolase family protein [Thermoleophilia bacterium]